MNARMEIKNIKYNIWTILQYYTKLGSIWLALHGSSVSEPPASIPIAITWLTDTINSGWPYQFMNWYYTKLGSIWLALHVSTPNPSYYFILRYIPYDLPPLMKHLIVFDSHRHGIPPYGVPQTLKVLFFSKTPSSYPLVHIL